MPLKEIETILAGRTLARGAGPSRSGAPPAARPRKRQWREKEPAELRGDKPGGRWHAN